MSSGGAGDRVRVSIPVNVRKTIQNIKEITGNHTDEEIYAMLKECSMDPNETTQKLLALDPFLEVRRKRDKKKENVNNKDAGDSRWRSGTQGRGSRGGRMNFYPRYSSHDGGNGRASAPGRESSSSQPTEKGVASSVPTSQEKIKETAAPESTVAVVANGPIAVASGTTGEPAGSITADKTLVVAHGTADTLGEPVPNSNSSSVSVNAVSSSTVCFSSSDPVLVPSNDSRVAGTVGTIKCEVLSHRVLADTDAGSNPEKPDYIYLLTAASGKNVNKSHVIGKGQFGESSQPSSVSVNAGSSGSRPSSNYGSRAQQVIGPQKAGATKEWIPKPTNPNVAQVSTATSLPEVPSVAVKTIPQSQLVSEGDKDAPASKLNKLKELNLPQRQHVIIPNHIHVPESERTKLSFGSFDTSFGVAKSYASGQESEKSSATQSVEEVSEEPTLYIALDSEDTVAVAEEGAYPDQPHSPSPVPGTLQSDGDVSVSAAPDYSEGKQENVVSASHPYPGVHSSPSYFGIVHPVLGGQIAQFENSESQPRDASRMPSFVVQQPFDPANYYAQFYRPGADNDGRVSPFPSPGVAAKYNGNVAVLPPHTSQSTREGTNSLVLSTAGPTALATQAAGLMQSSIPATQQPLPVFRPPTGLHMAHYPPNYIPYGHYFSPFYPPPGIHQFLSNGAFPQQPQAGNIFPAPPAAAAAAGVKFSVPQFKAGTNSTHMGMPSGYGPYASSPAGYNPSSAGAGVNSTTNEDLSASQLKENNVYLSGQQQSEGSAVWITAPGRDISTMPASSFYNLPPQGQHVAFAPQQAGHGPFAGIYHPAQAVSAAGVHQLLQQSQAMGGGVDMAGGPAGSVYQQQPQHQQVNWPSNF
ncbi:GBF-interacting protein 1 [Linum grandiflorum]